MCWASSGSTGPYTIWLPLPEPSHRAGRERRLREEEFTRRDRKASLELKDTG